MTDDNLEDIRERKKKELQKEQQEEQERREQMKKQELRKLLTSKARRRLSRLRLVQEDKVDAIENMIISQSRKINGKIDDDELKQIIEKVNEQENSNSMNIKSRDL